MNISIKDYKGNALAACEKIVECTTRLNVLLKDFNFQNDRAKIDRNLVDLNVYSQRLSDLLMPIPYNNSNLNVLGDSKKPTLTQSPIIIDKENPNLDFKDWFCEKITRIDIAIKRLMDNLAQPPDEYSKNYIQSINNFHLAEISQLAKNIFELFLSGRLLIQDLIVKPDEE